MVHPILELQQVKKTYFINDGELNVLNDIELSVPAGEVAAIIGPSGSGKSTLLALAAGLDRPTSGKVLIDSVSLTERSEDELAALRNEKVGFIFQSFQLIPTLTAFENVLVPLELQGRGKEVHDRAKELLAQVGLADRLDHYPIQLSGGEQQRVSIARAFINTPKLLFADEPTGNLDSDTSGIVEDKLFELNKSQGTTLVIVTHDRELAQRADRVITLKGGRIASDGPPES